MKTNNKKSSAAKKLIPAVSMLTASAVMLSTATYAWFTMNKTVEVTGLTMSATASNSLEISLGEITDGKPTNTAPSTNSKSWTRKVAINQYYATVGKLKPASTNVGTAIYFPDNAKVYAGGTDVKEGATITQAKTDNSATLTFQNSWTDLGGTLTSIDADADSGYFIDIPMWIRSNDNTVGGQDIYCTVTISDPDNTNGSELINAVRVAIIPVETAQSSIESSGADGISGLSLTGSVAMSKVDAPSETLASGTGSAKIFGITPATYNGTGDEATTQKLVASASNYADGSLASYAEGVFINAVNADNTSLNNADSNQGIVFKLPAAEADSYSGQSFIARVWLEGESKYCNDATANQDWNINFNFSLEPYTL